MSYPKDTIGYHHEHSVCFFGEDSAPTRWLEKKAAESKDGMDTVVVAHETTVIYLLNLMFQKEQEEKK